MSKELDKMSDETKYELNVYCRQLNKDLTNLMECLRKQDKDNQAILYVGKHIKKKVILPYEEYQKMYQRLEAIDNANPSEALKWLEKYKSTILFNTTIVENALLKAQEQEKENAELKSRIQDLEKDLEVLEILRNKPFILQKIFENKGLEPNAQKDYDGDYFWGTITEDEYQKVKEWLEKKDEHTPSK